MATIADENPFDADPARRPSLDDVGGAVMADKPTAPPAQDGSHPSAKMFNRLQELAASFGLVVPSVVMSVRFDGGEPVLDNMIAPGTLLQAADFTLIDNGDGDTIVRWFGTKLPTPALSPIATANDDGTHTIGARLFLNYDPDEDIGAHAVIVVTKVGTSGAAADVAFTLAIY